MTDHKFEPGQLVLVRNSDEHKWRLRHYSHFRNSADEHFFATIGERDYRQCIPFNDDTKHLQNTTQPYEPPKPPHEYKWGDKVAVRNADGKWNEAVFINFAPEDFFPFAAMIKGRISLEYFQKNNIRPLEPSDE